jgi:MFS family permease
VFLAQAIGELAGGLPGGMLADRLGPRRVLLISTGGMMIGYGSLCLVHHAVLGIGAFFLAGLFESAFHPTIAALTGDLHDGEHLHQAYGQVRVAANVGRIAGPLIGAAAAIVSIAAVFAATAVLLAAAFVIVVTTIPKEAAAIAGAESETPTEPSHTLLRDPRLLLLVVGGGLLSITFTWWEADGLVLLRHQHPLSASSYAALFAIAAAGTVLLQIPISRWARRRTTSRLLLLGAAAQGLGLAALSAGILGYPVLIGAVLAIALGQMLYSPAVSTFVSRRAARSQKASYQAAISTTEDIGTAIGPTVGLTLGATGAPYLAWLLAAPICLLAGAISSHATQTQRPGTQAAAYWSR